MSQRRSSAADALFAQLANGRGQTGQELLLAQLMQSGVPISPDMLAGVTQNSSRQGRARVLGAATNPFATPNPMGVDMSQVGDIVLDSGGQHIEQHGPPMREAERAAMLQAQIEALQPQILSKLALGDGPEAQQAQQALGLDLAGPSAPPADFANMLLGVSSPYNPEPMTAEGFNQRVSQMMEGADPEIARQFGEAGAQAMRPKIFEAQADLIKISEMMASPAITDQDREDLVQQFEQRWGPVFNVRPQAISPQQAEQLREELERQQVSAEAGNIPMVKDRRGDWVVNPGVTARMEYAREQARRGEALAAAERTRSGDAHRAMQAALRAIKPPPDASPAEHAAYQQLVVRTTNDYLAKLRGGEAPAASAAPAPPPAANGLPTIADEDDYDVLPSGAQFIDATDGQVYQKP